MAINAASTKKRPDPDDYRITNTGSGGGNTNTTAKPVVKSRPSYSVPSEVEGGGVEKPPQVTRTRVDKVVVPTDEQGRSQYDLRRRAIQERMAQQEQMGSEALKQRLAAQGVEDGSGIALKQQRMMGQSLGQQQAQQLSEVDIAELGAMQQSAEASAEREFVAGESAADRAQKYWQSYNSLNLQERQLLEDSRQFQTKQEFERWALTEGWNQDEIERVWQTQTQERKYEHDRNMVGLQNEADMNMYKYQQDYQQANAQQKAEADSWFTRGRAGESYTTEELQQLRMNNPTAYSGYMAGRAQYALDLQDHTRGLETVEAEIEGRTEALKIEGDIKRGLMTLEDSLKQARESRNQMNDYWYKVGINNEEIPIESFMGEDGELDDVEYSNWVAYNQGKQGYNYQTYQDNQARLDQYFAARIVGLDTEEDYYKGELREIFESMGIDLPDSTDATEYVNPMRMTTRELRTWWLNLPLEERESYYEGFNDTLKEKLKEALGGEGYDS